MMRRDLLAGVVAALCGVAACDGGTEPPERIVTTLGCDESLGTSDLNCAMTLQEPAGLRFELQTFTCSAHGNVLEIRTPVEQVLTSDACHLGASDGIWEFPGPFDEGTHVTLNFISAELRLAPGVTVTGSYPAWIINFEDGGDQDYDDLVLTVRVVPAG